MIIRYIIPVAACVVLLLVFCIPEEQHITNSAKRSWLLSHDFSEYHGFYVFSELENGELAYTHFPENNIVHPEPTSIIGTWKESGNTITHYLNESNSTSAYVKSKRGIYVSPTQKYQSFSIELIPVQLSDGQIILNNDLKRIQ
ncbi:MAG: hypothetical protein HQL32_15795 [Planctomycetes bacterium]|nr:hypothetical protein [Planctomycetota bacterium]